MIERAAREISKSGEGKRTYPRNDAIFGVEQSHLFLLARCARRKIRRCVFRLDALLLDRLAFSSLASFRAAQTRWCVLVVVGHVFVFGEGVGGKDSGEEEEVRGCGWCGRLGEGGRAFRRVSGRSCPDNAHT